MTTRRLNSGVDNRQTPRLKLPPMYTLIRARPKGSKRYCWVGHIYDISAAGMRFELDFPLEPGASIEVRAVLPGKSPTAVGVTGHVVRLHDDSGEPGPARMGLAIDRFQRPADEQRLMHYLSEYGLKAA